MPNQILVQIEELEAIKLFLLAVSMSYQEYNLKIINVADDSDSEEVSVATESESESSNSEESNEFININERDEDPQGNQHMNKAKEIFGNIIKQTKKLNIRKKTVSQTKMALRKW